MPASRLSYPTKTNNPSDPDSVRKFYADEANDVKAVSDNHADLLDNLDERLKMLELSKSPNPFYGRYTNISLLHASYPIGEENAWAVLDPGIGLTPEIAIWDHEDGVWEISGSTPDTIEVELYSDLPAPGQSFKWYLVRYDNTLHRWYKGAYHKVNAGTVQTTNSNKVTLVATEANQLTFNVSSKPPSVDIVHNDKWLTETYQYNYYPLTGDIVLIPEALGIDGLQIDEELNVRTYGDTFEKQILEATEEGQTVFSYSGNPSSIEVITNDGILTEGYAYTHTNFITGNYATLTNGVKLGSSVQINKH
ncbi:hypothetical protein [Thalassobellus citreus]|uniref:hypothetical protein n=1 Tax=Thalassobellus citreus TaxID=3367752 RepID=UPI0037A71F7D